MPVKATYRRVIGPASASGIRGSVIGSLAGKSLEMVTLVALATVVPRALGPEAYGRFSVPLTVVTLGSLAMTLGGPTVMARFVPDVPSDERSALARSLGLRLAKGRFVQLAVIAASLVVTVLLAPGLLDARTTAAVFVALALNVLATLALQVPLGLGRTGPWILRWPLQNAVVIIAVLALEPRFGDAGSVAAVVLSGAVGAAFGLLTLPRLHASEVATSREVPSGAIRFGMLQASGAGLTQFAQRGGVLAIAVLGGTDAEIGHAALAIGIALGATYAVLQTFTVTLPHLSSRAADDPGEATLRKLAGGMLALLVPAVIAATVLVGPLIRIVFGSEYEPAVDAFVPAIALVVLAPLNALTVQAAALRLKPEAALASGAAAAVGFVGVSLLAVPIWGAAGATTAALAGGLAAAVTATSLLPGAVGGRLATATAGGVFAVIALSALT